MPGSNNILLTGATGYIGGSVLDALIKNPAESLRCTAFDCLVRHQTHAEKLSAAYGDRVNPLLWSGLDDTAAVADIAAGYDLILNAGLAFHPNGGKPFVEGLARRLAAGKGPTPWILHVNGCTTLSDRPITQQAFPDLVWDDADSAVIYEYLKREEEREPYVQRTNEISTLETAEATGVQALCFNTPLIFGQGRGHFSKNGLINFINMRFILNHGWGFKFNDTANFDWAHIDDLADLWVLAVRAILERPDRGVGYIPSGTRGIIFPAVARVSCTEIMQRCLNVAFEAGVLPRNGTPLQKEVRLIKLEDVCSEITAGAIGVLERGWAGHKAMKGTMAAKLLGWTPRMLQDAWEKDFLYVLQSIQTETSGSKAQNMEQISSVIGLKA